MGLLGFCFFREEASEAIPRFLTARYRVFVHGLECSTVHLRYFEIPRLVELSFGRLASGCSSGSSTIVFFLHAYAKAVVVRVFAREGDRFT